MTSSMRLCARCFSWCCGPAHGRACHFCFRCVDHAAAHLDGSPSLIAACGHIQQVGYCGFFWQIPVRPRNDGCLRHFAGRGHSHDCPRKKNLFYGRFDILTALIYAALAYLLAPLVGTTPTRYDIYGWPVFGWWASATSRPVSRP